MDDVNDEKIVEQLTGECGRLFKRCEAQLKRLGSDAEVTNTANEFDDIGTKMRKNATRKLAMELSRLSQAFRQRQKEYLNELKNRQDRGLGAEGVDALEDVFRNRVARSHSGFLEQSDGGSMTSSQMQQRQGFANQDVMSLEAEERDTEVKKILQSVTDLADGHARHVQTHHRPRNDFRFHRIQLRHHCHASRRRKERVGQSRAHSTRRRAHHLHILSHVHVRLDDRHHNPPKAMMIQQQQRVVRILFW